jgi:UrcA family protein
MTMNQSIRVILLGALLATGVAQAGEAPRAKIVHFNDLDLNTPEGARVLYGRIQAAARDVCAPPMTGNLATAAEEQGCRARAIDLAVRAVNAAQLTALRFGTKLLVARK